MSACRSGNCTRLGDLQMDPDIAGIGVSGPLLLSNKPHPTTANGRPRGICLPTLIIVTVYYLINHQPTASPADQVIVESLEILLQRRFETA
jgi:hypothetical protein